MEIDLKRLIKSKLFTSMGIYSFSNIISSAIPFFLLPILTHHLSPDDYGIISMFGVVISMTIPFVGLSVNGAISRMYYERENIDFKVYIGNCVYILLFSTLMVFIISFIFRDVIARITSLSADLIFIAIVISFCTFIIKVVLVLWQLQVKPVYYGTFQIGKTLIDAALSLTFVVIIGMSWKGRISAQIMANIIFALIGTIILLKNKWIKLSTNISYIKNALTFGVPLIPHTIGGIVMTMTDRVFITNMVGISTTGVYAVGYQIGMIINILATSFNQAFVPWLYEQLKINSYLQKIKIVKFTYFYFVVIVFFAIILSYITPFFIARFIGNQFEGAYKYVIWIALGYAFNGMYYMVTNYIFYSQKTKFLSIVTFFSAVINVVLNYYFINKNGAIGAAQATTLVFFIRFVFTWHLSNKSYSMPWNLKTIVK